jgi:hypothetical protein
MTPVCEVVVEDCFDRFRGFVERPFLADVDPLVCIASKDARSLWIKGLRIGS